MSMPNRATGLRRPRPLSANDRWKQQWGAVLRGSLTVAVFGHLTVLAGWPQRTITWEPPDSAAGPVQLVRLASSDLAHSPDMGTRPEEALPAGPLPPAEPALTPPPPADQTLDLAPPPPRLAQASEASNQDARPEFAPDLRTASAPALSLRSHGPPPMQLAFSWPEILNPREMVRFLRSRYNPLHTPQARDRFVSVAMWIDDKGNVEWSEVHESSGHSIMDQIALAVVNEVVRFSPASRDGVPVSVGVVLSIPFQLEW
jgi:TonB family protein